MLFKNFRIPSGRAAVAYQLCGILMPRRRTGGKKARRGFVVSAGCLNFATSKDKGVPLRLAGRAEIIPSEPEADNAAVGICRSSPALGKAFPGIYFQPYFLSFKKH